MQINAEGFAVQAAYIDKDNKMYADMVGRNKYVKTCSILSMF